MGFFSDLFGGSARRDIERGRRRAHQHINTHFGQGRQAGEEWNERALRFLEPTINRGQRASELYDDAIGINGRERQQAFFTSFEDDPGFNETLKAGQTSLATHAASKGYALSGRSLKELHSYGQRHKQDAFNTRLDRLERQSGVGAQTRAAGANLINQTGMAMMGSHFNQGSALANIDFQSGVARANTRFSIGDLVGLLSGAGRVFGAFT